MTSQSEENRSVENEYNRRCIDCVCKCRVYLWGYIYEIIRIAANNYIVYHFYEVSPNVII